MPSKKKKAKYVAIEDLATDLGLIEWDLRAILHEIVPPPPIRPDHRGREAVPDTCIVDITASSLYATAIHHALISETRQRIAEEKGNGETLLRQSRERLLNEYRPLIAELERVHRKYIASANQAGLESPGMAVYLLISRVISTLKMAHDCLRIGHWYTGSLFREIDECLDLARYFVITKDTPNGTSIRQRWFRLNISPKHSDCREAISTWHTSIMGVKANNHLELMNELYHKKSKWTHPTYLPIREIASYNVSDTVSLTSVDYGPCNYEGKLLELTDFFRSSIWSTFQCLAICFQLALTLSDEDVSLLHEYDKKFQKKTPID
jgi:hypothetical protein